MNGNQEKATRAKAPRVRTGCITWKRRLKCDERKPVCHRCESANLVCGGYEIPTRKPRTLGTRFRIKTPPEAEDEDKIVSEPLKLTFSPSLVDDASDLPIQMDLFHHARTVTLEDLETALSPTNFWHSYVLPLSHTAKAVKYAICALGGAHRVFKVQRYKTHPGLSELQDISVQQYNQAIRCVQSVMERPTEQDMQIVLTCCLVFISIENLHGRYAESLRHLRAGTSLLMSLMSEQHQHDDGLYTSRDTESGAGATTMSNFLYDISQALCRLGSDVWKYVREMISPDLNFDATTDTELLSQRTAFESIDQAERAFHDVAKLFEADVTSSAPDVFSWIPFFDSEFRQPASGSSEPLVPQHLIPPEELKIIFNNWSHCFDLFQSGFDESAATKQELVRLRSLAVDQALWSGWLKCKFWSDYQPQDYEEILRRAESLIQLDGFQSAPVFTFDGSLILSLAIPCVSSMDCDIQWRAIRLLRSLWRREGIWDSQELADILEATMIATSTGMVTKDMLPWDVPHLARLMHSLKLEHVSIPEAPLSLTQSYMI